MQYIHIKNIEKYNPGHKDRQHIWAKIYYKSFLNEDFQELNEIDRYRLWSLIVFETYHQKPVALTRINLALLGWDTKKRPISKTLQMLRAIINVRSENVAKSERRVEESRVEESRGEEIYVDFEKSTLAKWNSFCDKFPVLPKIKQISQTRRGHLKKRFEDATFRDFDVLLQAISEQPFLLGQNQRKWTISFDWLIANDTNYIKVLEHKYKSDGSDMESVRERLKL